MSASNGLIVVALTVEGTAIALVLFAGHLYVRGAIARSRPIARRAGIAAAAATLAVVGLLAFAGRPGQTAAGSTSWIAAIFVAAAGVAALLGGLSGKPRPAGEVAALLWSAALVALVRGW